MSDPYENLICHIINYKPAYKMFLPMPSGWRSIMSQFSGKVKVHRGKDGPMWEVGVLVDRNNPKDGGCFSDGWAEFVRDNEIVKGEVLKVYYVTFGTFYVRIFTDDEKERDSRRQNEALNLIMDQSNIEKLEIPMCFGATLGMNQSVGYIYQGERNKLWRLHFQMATTHGDVGDIVIDEGWETYVQENGIEVGYKLQICFEGDGILCSRVFDRDGVDITYSEGGNRLNSPRLNNRFRLLQESCVFPSFPFIFSSRCILEKKIVIPRSFAEQYCRSLNRRSEVVLNYHRMETHGQFEVTKDTNNNMNHYCVRSTDQFFLRIGVVPGCLALIVAIAISPFVFDIRMDH